MYMTEEEDKMYDGEYGPLYEWAMRFLAAYGDGLNAERLVKVSAVLVDQLEKPHYLRPQLSSDLYETFLKTRMAVPTYTSTLFFTEKDYRNQKDVERQYEDMGVFLTGSCAAHTAGWVPTFGSHVASIESAMYVYTNSVFGARTHRESYPGIFAVALTGKTPYAGLHTEEGRRGNLLVKVEAKMKTHEYFALGYHVGKLVTEDRNRPVFTGLSDDVGPDELKHLGAALQLQGSVGLYHAVKITPEAPTLEAAFGGDKPQETITVGEDEIGEACTKLNRGEEGQEIDYVILGCPHYSIKQVARVAELLRGKKIHKDVKLGILTAPAVNHIAERMGIKGIIESAGGEIVGGGCFRGWIRLKESEREKPRRRVSVATDSAKCAWFRVNAIDRSIDRSEKPCFGCTEECVNAAISKKWGN
jgi:predicted aconitase